MPLAGAAILSRRSPLPMIKSKNGRTIMKTLIVAILLLAVMQTARGEANLTILTCPDRYGPMVFSLNLKTHSVVSAIDKNFGKSRFMFGGVPISATETELVW